MVLLSVGSIIKVQMQPSNRGYLVMDEHPVISISCELASINDQIGAQTCTHVEIGMKRHMNAEQFLFRQELSEFFAYLLWRVT